MPFAESSVAFTSPPEMPPVHLMVRGWLAGIVVPGGKGVWIWIGEPTLRPVWNVTAPPEAEIV